MEIGKATHRRVATIVLFAVFAMGCGPGPEDEGPGPVSDEIYVQVMTELMLLDASPPEGGTVEEREARADSARREILSGQGVTGPEVLDFAEALGGEAGRMEVLWQEITQRYDSARIASLGTETEARSEPEGKLGEVARAAATEPSPAPVAGAPPASADTLQPANRRLRPRTRRPLGTRPPVRDTTFLPG
jgi:hypothetical protein